MKRLFFFFSLCVLTIGIAHQSTNATHIDTPHPTLLKEINPRTKNAGISDLVVMNDVAYFAVDSEASGHDLWRSDGTSVGTYLLLENILAGEENLSEGGLTAVDGVLYFSADNGTNGFELWRSDGTEAGTYTQRYQ